MKTVKSHYSIGTGSGILGISTVGLDVIVDLFLLGTAWLSPCHHCLILLQAFSKVLGITRLNAIHSIVHCSRFSWCRRGFICFWDSVVTPIWVCWIIFRTIWQGLRVDGVLQSPHILLLRCLAASKGCLSFLQLNISFIQMLFLCFLDTFYPCFALLFKSHMRTWDSLCHVWSRRH